jgi:hypothetical protein
MIGGIEGREVRCRKEDATGNLYAPSLCPSQPFFRTERIERTKRADKAIS